MADFDGMQVTFSTKITATMANQQRSDTCKASVTVSSGNTVILHEISSKARNNLTDLKNSCAASAIKYLDEIPTWLKQSAVYISKVDLSDDGSAKTLGTVTFSGHPNHFKPFTIAVSDVTDVESAATQAIALLSSFIEKAKTEILNAVK